MNKLVLTVFFWLGILSGYSQQVMHHSKLSQYLPESVEGFLLEGKAEGVTIEVKENSYSMISKKYKKNNQELEITMFDYSLTTHIYESISGVWRAKMSINTDDQKAYTSTIDTFPCWIGINKKKERVELFMGVHESFVVTASCKKCSEDLMLSIVQSLDLGNLPQ